VRSASVVPALHVQKRLLWGREEFFLGEPGANDEKTDASCSLLSYLLCVSKEFIYLLVNVHR